MNYMKSAPGRLRRGIVSVLVAVFLIALIGILAIALDGGVLQDNKRRVQTAADAAATAAAANLFQHYPQLTPASPDPSDNAKNAAIAVATANGYTTGSTATVTVNIPPQS